MKKILSLLTTALLLIGCSPSKGGFEMKQIKDEISWKNSLIQFRTHTDLDEEGGHYLGFDASLKKEDGKTIHMPIDAYGPGYGASFPLGTLGLYKPDKGIGTTEILSMTDEKMVIHIGYNQWTVVDVPVVLDKQITLFRDSPIMSVIDYYTGHFDLLNVAAGLTTATEGEVSKIENGFVIEYPTYGITAVIVMPGAEQASTDETSGYAFVKKAVADNEPLRYYVGLSDKGKEYLLDELTKIL